MVERLWERWGGEEGEGGGREGDGDRALRFGGDRDWRGGERARLEREGDLGWGETL